MVTATDSPTRPAAGPIDPPVTAVVARRPSRPDGVFARPEDVVARAVGRPRPRRTAHRRRRRFRIVARVLHELRLPPPIVDTSLRPAPTRLDTAAAIGQWMRRRDDPNP